MPSQDLLTISSIAFAGVLLLLAVLAGIIRLITLVFPSQEAENDSAIVAAVTSTYSVLFPGSRVSKMEERK